ncbi:hypothetical protein ACT4US_10420 [Bacillus sp. HC-Mk]
MKDRIHCDSFTATTIISVSTAICAGIGGLVYGLLAIRTGVLERVFGGEALDKIQRKLGSRFKIKLKSRGA